MSLRAEGSLAIQCPRCDGTHVIDLAPLDFNFVATAEPSLIVIEIYGAMTIVPCEPSFELEVHLETFLYPGDGSAPPAHHASIKTPRIENSRTTDLVAFCDGAQFFP